MTTDGRRSVKLKSQDVIDYVENFAKAKHMRLFEVIDYIVRDYRAMQKQGKEYEVIMNAEIPADSALPVINAMLASGHTVSLRRNGAGIQIVVRQKKGEAK